VSSGVTPPYLVMAKSGVPLNNLLVFHMSLLMPKLYGTCSLFNLTSYRFDQASMKQKCVKDPNSCSNSKDGWKHFGFFLLQQRREWSS